MEQQTQRSTQRRERTLRIVRRILVRCIRLSLPLVTPVLTGLFAMGCRQAPHPSLAATIPEAALSEKGLETFKKLLSSTNSRAAVVLYRGRPAVEWYWQGEGPNSVFEVWSVTKTFASTAIGLLIDEGRIGSVEDPVSKYVPEWRTGKKSAITIAHLLDQTSGLKETGRFLRADDQLAAALSADVVTTPGLVSRYNNAACNVLSAVISSASGKDPEVYLREKLWAPLGMNHTSWRRDKAGHVITYAGIQTSANDLARFGQLFLDDGMCAGKRIISHEWIEQATHKRSRIYVGPFPVADYGLLWWLDFNKGKVPHNYSALGLFGNHLTVIPELNLVGVRLVGSQGDGMSLMFRVAEWVSALAGVVEQK